MYIKKTSTLLISLISSATCLSFGFLTNFLRYNGLEFFYVYITFLILLCYPMNVVVIYLHRTLPNLYSHTSLVSNITGTSKFKYISILFTIVMIFLISLLMFNISTYVLDIFNNIFNIDKLNNVYLSFNTDLFIYISLSVVFIVISIFVILINFKKINFNNLFQTTANIYLYLVIIMFIVIFLSQSINNKYSLYFEINYQNIENIRSMFGIALIYAILSNFISIAFYKNLMNIIDNDYNDLKIAALKSIIYNIVFLFMICITLSLILGNYVTSSQTDKLMSIELLFTIIKSNLPIYYYLLLEFLFIIFNLLVFISALKYIYRLCQNIFTKIFFLIIILIITIILMKTGITYIDFSDMFGLHFVIIFIFLFDIFIIGWIYDAQKLSYEVLKYYGTHISPLFNIILRIFIPFICIFVVIGYIFIQISIISQLISTFFCIIIYIIKGTIFNNILNKRNF